MSKSSHNFNVGFYKLLGYIWFLWPIFLSAYMIYQTPSWEDFGISLLLYFIYWILSGILRYGAKMEIMSLSKIFKKPKFVFHDDLGYFSVYFFDSYGDKSAYVEIYKQSFLTLKHIDNLDIVSSEQVKSGIKSILDKRYYKKLKDIKEREERTLKDKTSKSYLDEWDGYLSPIGRRDEKIKSVLKK